MSIQLVLLIAVIFTIDNSFHIVISQVSIEWRSLNK